MKLGSGSIMLWGCSRPPPNWGWKFTDFSVDCNSELFRVNSPIHWFSFLRKASLTYLTNKNTVWEAGHNATWQTIGLLLQSSRWSLKCPGQKQPRSRSYSLNKRKHFSVLVENIITFSIQVEFQETDLDQSILVY